MEKGLLAFVGEVGPPHVETRSPLEGEVARVRGRRFGRQLAQGRCLASEPCDWHGQDQQVNLRVG